MRVVVMVVLAWSFVATLVGLVVARGIRLGRGPAVVDRAPARPAAQQQVVVDDEPDPQVVVAVHGLQQSASVLEAGLDNLRSSWDRMQPEARAALLDGLHGQAAIVHEVLDALLTDTPALARVLDSLQRDPQGAWMETPAAAG